MYRITQVLSVGPFATLERVGPLRAAGVTHVLNVADTPSLITATEQGFREVVWSPLENDSRMPLHRVIPTLDTLHRLATQPQAQVYVHCHVGHSRSPTVVWLYLIALGIPPDVARNWIEERSPVAAPGHRRLVDHEHIGLAQRHGLMNYFPHPRPELIVPAAIEGQLPARSG
jgi:protein-tyrosine phosphatase